MDQFPRLKTGAVAQYPMEKTQHRPVHVYRFVDGSEQRFPAHGKITRRWMIHLEQLDETELLNLEAFFVSQAGRAGGFAFIDPWDEIEYPNCSFDGDVFVMNLDGANHGSTALAVRENR